MQDVELRASIQQIFRDFFEDDDIVVTDELSALDIEGWDSMAHVSLLLEIEEAFSVKFKLNEIARLKNVGDLIEILKSHDASLR